MISWWGLIIAFLLGVGLGVAGRAWWDGVRVVRFEVVGEASGHTEPVPASTPRLRRLILVMVLVSVALSATANVMQIRNGQADKRRVACTVEYNKLDGIARDDRDTAAKDGTRDELAFLRAIKKQTLAPGANPQVQAAQFLATLQDRIVSLRTIQRTRSKDPYPSPAACEDGRMTDEERIGK